MNAALVFGLLLANLSQSSLARSGEAGSTAALAEGDPVVVVANPEPMELFKPVDEAIQSQVISEHFSSPQRFNRLIRRTPVGVVAVAVEALKADHRHVDIIIKNGVEERFDWCIGEIVLISIEGVTYRYLTNSVEEAPDGSTWTINGDLETRSGSFRLVVYGDNSSVMGTIATSNEHYFVKPIGEGGLHIIYRK